MSPWQIILGILTVVCAAIPGAWSAINIRSGQRQTSDLERRKVDSEAFDRAERLLTNALTRAELRIKELERIKDDLEAKNYWLESQVHDMQLAINALKAAMIARGIPVPEVKDEGDDRR